MTDTSDEPKFEDGVPIPRPRSAKYNYEKMKVGQALFLELEDITGARHDATRFKKKSGGTWNYTTRKVPGGYRLWRTA